VRSPGRLVTRTPFECPRKYASRVEAPAIWNNWRAALIGDPSNGSTEYPLYTDAHLTGQIKEGLGPHELLNPVPVKHGPGLFRPGVVLRLESHLSTELPDLSKTTAVAYHGGALQDEVAALLALSLGIRMQSGGPTRWFTRGGDPLGSPMAWDSNPPQTVPFRSASLLVPDLISTRALGKAQAPLRLIPTMTPRKAAALVRAARLYQDGVWISETEPSLSWLLLVSAIETAASYQRGSHSSPTERLRESQPDLAQDIEQIGGTSLLGRVADTFANTLGATKAFLDFLEEYWPRAPALRPPYAWARLKWRWPDAKRALRVVYGHRSKALHDGRPFPAPMCGHPIRQRRWKASAELPISLAVHTLGGTWVAKDVPMHLHIFEYMVRTALTSWWIDLSAT
jgi:hypothetical protein